MIDICQIYFEELEFLWAQRQRALRSAECGQWDLSQLDERIEAHVDGLLVAGEAALPLLEEGISGDEPLVVFAAAYTLLRTGDARASDRVVDAFMAAREGQLDGLREALCHGSIDRFVERLRQAMMSSSAPRAVAAAEILAFHRKLDRSISRLCEFFQDENAAVRCSAWRVAAMLPATL